MMRTRPELLDRDAHASAQGYRARMSAVSTARFTVSTFSCDIAYAYLRCDPTTGPALLPGGQPRAQSLTHELVRLCPVIAGLTREQPAKVERG